MKIDHIAIWVNELETVRKFYCKYFGMKSSEKYVNKKKHFSSYFLSFENGARIEIMQRPDIKSNENKQTISGFTHLAISVGNREKVDELTETLRNDGFKIFGEPRVTGDGYYESVVADPEGNSIEITE